MNKIAGSKQEFSNKSLIRKKPHGFTHEVLIFAEPLKWLTIRSSNKAKYGGADETRTRDLPRDRRTL